MDRANGTIHPCDVCSASEADAGEYIRITGVAKGLRKYLCIPCADFGVKSGRIAKVEEVQP